MLDALPPAGSTAGTGPPEPCEESSAPTVLFPFAGGDIGGSHVSALKLIKALDPSRFRPLVGLHRIEGQLPAYLATEGIAFEALPSASFLGRSWGLERGWNLREAWSCAASLPQLTAFLRCRDIRIVHTNDAAMHMTWALPAKLARALLLWHHRSGPEGRGIRFAAPLLADRVAAVSHYALSGAPGRLQRRASVIYSPFETRDIPADRQAGRRALTQELGLRPDTRLIGFFGNIDHRKRPLVFVDALAALGRRAPGLDFAGLMFGGTLDDALREQVAARARELALGSRFHLLGFRQPSAPLLAACDVHAVTAVGEPFGRSLIEAMLLGTPVVAAASGGNIEAIEPGITGVLVAPDDPDAMAAALQQLLAAPDRTAAMALEARRRAQARFGVERHAADIQALYSAMLRDDPA